MWFTIVFYIVPLFHGFSNFILLNRDCKYLRTLTGVIGPNSDFVQFTADLGLNNSNPLEVNLGLVTWQVLNLHIVINLQLSAKCLIMWSRCRLTSGKLRPVLCDISPLIYVFWVFRVSSSHPTYTKHTEPVPGYTLVK